jgi:hypothetical protein
MRVPNAQEKKSRSLLVITAIVAAALIGTAVLAVGRSSSNISITVKNQTQRTITHLYLAPGDPNNWGPDQLNGSTIPPDGSYVLNNVACNGSSSVRVIAEDQNGCFFYNTAACDANYTWEISAAATPDCGGN